MFPTDPKIWVTQFAPVGALKSWLERDVKLPMAPYVQSDVPDFAYCVIQTSY